MAYDVGVRSYLQGQGVANSDISYDPNSGNVTVQGQNFIKPSLNMAGTTYDSQQNLDNAYGNYTKTQNSALANAAGSAAGVTPGTGQGGSTGNTGTPGATGGNTGSTSNSSSQPTYSNPYTQTIKDIMQHLSDKAAEQPTDIYSSPQYAAAQANQARQSQLAVRQANEQAAGAGLGHSTIMTDRSQRIQDDSNNYLQTQLVPQIIGQLQAQRQQEIANQQNQLHDYMTLGQQADAQNNANRNFEAGRQDAATAATGYFNPSGMSAEQIQQQINANQAKWQPNPTNDPAIAMSNDKLHQDNLQLNGLLGKTYDPNTGTYSGGNGQVGTRTLAGQTLDLNNVKDMAALTGKMPDGTLTNAAQQQQLANEWTASEKLGTITPALAQLYGLPAGTKTEAAKQFAITSGIQQQGANTAAYSAQTGRLNEQNNANIANANAFGTKDENGNQSIDYQTKTQDNLYKIWNESGKAPEGIPGVKAGTPLNSATVQQRELANAYKTWNETGVAPEGIPGVAPGTPKYNAVDARHQGMNDSESNYITQLDTVPNANLKAALEAHKAAITKDVGTGGYTKIYNTYFDSFGNPK